MTFTTFNVQNTLELSLVSVLCYNDTLRCQDGYLAYRKLIHLAVSTAIKNNTKEYVFISFSVCTKKINQ